MNTPVIRLKDLCSLITKGTTPTSIGFDFSDDGIGFLRVQNVIGGSVNFQYGTLFIEESVHQELRRSQILPGDILLSIAGTIGRTGVVAAHAPALNCNQALAIIRPDEKVFRPFLRHWLESTNAQSQMRGATVTGTIQNLSLAQVGGLLVPLPPLPEQRRIATILDQADALRAKRREALAQLDSLTQSIFIELFGDPVSNPKGWPDALTLGDVADIASGVTKGRDLAGKNTRMVPYLAVANVQDKFLRLDGIKMLDATDDEIHRFRLQKDDLLLTEGGDPDKLGRGTLWNGELPHCIHQNHVFRVRITSDQVTPIFLNWLVGSQRGKQYFLKSAKQTTGIASINMSQLRRFPLLVPTRHLQQTFAARIQSVEALKASHRAALQALDKLFASLQHRAFAGEL